MGSESLNVFTLIFLFPGLLLAWLLYRAFRDGNTRASLLMEALVQQYGVRKGRIVAVVLFLLFLLGAWGIVWMRRGMYWGLVGALK